MKIEFSEKIKKMIQENPNAIRLDFFGTIMYANMIEAEAHRRVIREYENSSEYREKMAKEIEALLEIVKG